MAKFSETFDALKKDYEVVLQAREHKSLELRNRYALCNDAIQYLIEQDIAVPDKLAGFNIIKGGLCVDHLVNESEIADLEEKILKIFSAEIQMASSNVVI